MLFTFLTTLIMYSSKEALEICWCSSSIACQEKITDWTLLMIKIHHVSPKFQQFSFLRDQKWSKWNRISLETICHIPNIKKVSFWSKKQVFSNSFLFIYLFLRPHINSETNPLSPFSMLFASIWGRFVAQVSMLLLSQHAATLSRR